MPSGGGACIVKAESEVAPNLARKSAHWLPPRSI